MSTAKRVWNRRLSVCAVLSLLVFNAGCFEQSYLDRMQVTVKLYNHYDLLNRNLQAASNVDGFQIRVPIGFQQMPGPVPPENADPEHPNESPAATEAVIDPRQPDYLGIELPGMISAWQKEVKVDNGQAAGTRMAYLYLLSNSKLFGIPEGQPGRIDPLKFHEHTVRLLAGDLGVHFKEEDWRREQFPNGFDLVPRVTCDVQNFLPDRPISDTKMNFRVYLTSQGDIQALFLWVFPDDIIGPEKLKERIPLTMETVRLPDKPGNTLSGGAAAPAGGGF